MTVHGKTFPRVRQDTCAILIFDDHLTFYFESHYLEEMFSRIPRQLQLFMDAQC